jgi:hypothetical protein
MLDDSGQKIDNREPIIDKGWLKIEKSGAALRGCLLMAGTPLR